MKYTRIYADAAGESHLQDVDPAMKPAGNASTMSELIAAKGVIFRETRSGEYLIDWHNAPRRQFVVNLTGEGEIEVSDGGKRSMFHSFTRVGDIRRRTSSCWRRTRFSASSHARLVNLGRKESSSWI